MAEQKDACLVVGWVRNRPIRRGMVHPSWKMMVLEEEGLLEQLRDAGGVWASEWMLVVCVLVFDPFGVGSGVGSDAVRFGGVLGCWVVVCYRGRQRQVEPLPFFFRFPVVSRGKIRRECGVVCSSGDYEIETSGGRSVRRVGEYRSKRCDVFVEL